MSKSVIYALLACLFCAIGAPLAAQATFSATDLTWNGGGHFYATEGNWDLDTAHGWITATNFGSYIKVAFSLPSNSYIKLNLVETGLASDALIGSEVDGVNFQRVPASSAAPGGAAPATHQITLASGLSAGVHSAMVWVASVSLMDRWTPYNAVRVSGFEVSAGGSPVTLAGAVDVNGNSLTLYPKRMWVTGDSIAEGYVDGGSFTDGYYSWPILLGQALGCEVSNIAYSGAGYGVPAFGVPLPWTGDMATSSVTNYFAGRPKTNGTHFKPQLQPDYFLTEYGRNDQVSDSTAHSSAAFSAALSAFLQEVRSLCDPAVKTTRIFCIVPFAVKNNTLPYKAEIDAYFATQTDKNCYEVALPLSDCYVDNSGPDFRTALGATNETTDGIHPTFAEHRFLASAFTQIIGGILTAAIPTDFNKDGVTDLVWENDATGDAVAWYMNKSQWTGVYDYLGRGVAMDWKIVGVADLNQDGSPDLIWQNQVTGDVSYWRMNGTQFVSGDYIARAVPLEWKIVSVNDLNGDGNADLVWQNTATGDIVYWVMNGTAWTGTWDYVARNVPTEWKIVACADMNGDGSCDLIWQNTRTGDALAWYMNKAAWTGSYDYIARNLPIQWKIVAAAEFYGSGSRDLVWQNAQTGDVVVWAMHGVAWTGSYDYIAHNLPTQWRIVGPR